MKRRWDWRRWLSAVFVVAAFGFLGAAVYQNLEELRHFPWQVRPGLLLLSIALHVGVLLWGVKVWQLLLRRLRVEVSYRAIARVWFLSSIARYIPGKIWQFVGAAHLGASAGLPSLVTVTSLAVQMGFSLLAAGLTAIYLLPTSLGDLGGVAFPLLRWIAPLLLLLVHPSVIQAGLQLFHRLARRPTARWEGKWTDGVWLLALSVVGWVLYGAALYLFLAALVPRLPPTAVFPLGGMNALAFLVGYLVFVAPAGLGAKEGVLAALLATLVPGSVAALLAVATRLWSVAAEVVPALLFLRQPRTLSLPDSDVPEAMEPEGNLPG
jgi:uncharacterized membrane protein YbhN (UPF0104 family)